MEVFNPNLWSDEIYRQMKLSFKFANLIYSDKEHELEKFVEHHKCFAFRVDDLGKAQSDPILLSEYAAQGARGLASTIERSIAGFMRDIIFYNEHDSYEEKLTMAELAEEIEILLKHIQDNTIIVFPVSEIRVQSAYDLDYLATSVVGDFQYKIGIKKDDRPRAL